MKGRAKMISFLKQKLNGRTMLLLLLLCGVLAIFIARLTLSAVTEENHIRVKEKSELTYYLDVIYDGKDSEVVTSSDSATAEVKSNNIYIEDKIPEGLTFKRFLTSEDGTIGAVKRSDGSSCSGYVVDDAAGLHYDAATRTVSFTVKNLKAGCKLTVGIVTETPLLSDYGVDRMDFYNTGHARENDQSLNSNTVHAYIGREDMIDYVVSYKYTGEVPASAPAAPANTSYVQGAPVGVEASPVAPGYTFSGWTTEDVTVNNNKFTMPAKNVVFVGHFTKNTLYHVSYTLNGDIPEGFKPPITKEYASGVDVKVDSLKKGDVINGYRFLGWTTTDPVDLAPGIFVMPSQDVEIVGQFEKIKYKVEYEFQGTVIPVNPSSVLPPTETHYPEEIVTVNNNIPSTTCRINSGTETKPCVFLGWYSKNTFKMPAKDVLISGEWKIADDLFSPIITKDLKENRKYYKNGEVIEFNITVANTESYPIKDVLLTEQLDGVSFIPGDGYTVLNDKYVKIGTVPANGNVVVKAQFTAGSEIIKAYTNRVELIGAIADNDKALDTSKEYIAEEDFYISNISLSIDKVNSRKQKLNGAKFALYSDEALTDKVGEGLSFGAIEPNKTYYLREITAPDGYKLLNKTLKVVVDASGKITIDGYTVDYDEGVNTVSIVNDPIDILPSTGGTGNIKYIIIGVAIVILGCISYMIYTRKKGYEC